MKKRAEVTHKLMKYVFKKGGSSENCILVIWSFGANIHLSVSTCHVCSFVTKLPHSGRYFLDPSFACELHEVIDFIS